MILNWGETVMNEAQGTQAMPFPEVDDEQLSENSHDPVTCRETENPNRVIDASFSLSEPSLSDSSTYDSSSLC